MLEPGSPTASPATAVERAAALADDYARDGVVFLSNALDEKAMTIIDAAFDWKFEQWTEDNGTSNYDDRLRVFGDSSVEGADEFQRIMTDTILPDIATALLRSEKLWYFGEQLFWKKGFEESRTPWHQDAPYLKIDGEQSVIMWIGLDDVPREAALEVVPGSHRGIMYNGTTFGTDDVTEPVYLEGDMPRLPDIEAERDNWDIAGWPSKRGDILIFHMLSLHGGAPTWPGYERRSISLRFLGDDVVSGYRPIMRDGFRQFFKLASSDEAYARLEKLPIGTPIGQIEGFPLVRPARARRA